MSNRIVLISDDVNFFDFIKNKLELRKSDELFTFGFEDVPEKMDLLQTSVIIVNSEQAGQKTIEFLKLFNSCTPIIVIAYNEDDSFKKKCYRAGMFDFITLLTPDAEFRARMLPALNIASVLTKNQQYRSLLVKNKILNKNSEIFTDYKNILNNILSDIKENNISAVFAIISPKEKDKYLINPSVIETFLINNIRKTDIIINYMPNKYFLILYNTDLASAKKHWKKIIKDRKHDLYAGFVQIENHSESNLISCAINELNLAFSGKTAETINEKEKNDTVNTNFKIRRRTSEHKFNVMVTPIFYRLQQKYSNRFTGVKLAQSCSNDRGTFSVTGKHFNTTFKITNPGFSKINIVITLKKDAEKIESKRFSFESNEFDETLLEDLMEQFISEAKYYAS